MFSKTVIKFNENLQALEDKYTLLEESTAEQVNNIVDAITSTFIDASASAAPAASARFITSTTSVTSAAPEAPEAPDYSDEEAAPAEKDDENSRDVYTRLRRAYAKILRYLHKTWIGSWKKKFVRCWIDRFLHLLTTTISRAESAHNVLKAQLGFSTGDLYTVLIAIEVLLTNQLKDWYQELAIAKDRTAHQHRISMFRKLISHMPPYGLWKILASYNLGNEESSPRRYALRRVYWSLHQVYRTFLQSSN